MVPPSVTSTSKSTKAKITLLCTADETTYSVHVTNLAIHHCIGNTNQTRRAMSLPMITSKTYLIKIMKDCEGADTLTREEKFQVFCKVCDNMLNDGRMTKATHKRFTEIW